jgi:hypothetical protein
MTVQDKLRLGLRQSVGRFAGYKLQRLLGFWFVWHTFGGLNGTAAALQLTKAGLHRQRHEFLEAFGVKVEDFAPELAALLAAGLVLPSAPQQMAQTP